MSLQQLGDWLGIFIADRLHIIYHLTQFTNLAKIWFSLQLILMASL